MTRIQISNPNSFYNKNWLNLIEIDQNNWILSFSTSFLIYIDFYDLLIDYFDLLIKLFDLLIKLDQKRSSIRISRWISNWTKIDDRFWTRILIQR